MARIQRKKARGQPEAPRPTPEQLQEQYLFYLFEMNRLAAIYGPDSQEVEAVYWHVRSCRYRMLLPQNIKPLSQISAEDDAA
jgi:hypothetical protein